MSRNDLIEALHQKGDRQIRRLWEEAESELEEERRQAEARFEEKRESLRKTTTGEVAAASRSLCLEAERQAEELRASTRRELAIRLRRLADDRLGSLARSKGNRLFAVLADELPKIEWQTIFVSSTDLALAEDHFPESAVVPADRIGSGLEAVSRDGGLTVVNTLEKRLDRIWPRLLPRLLSEVEEARCR